MAEKQKTRIRKRDHAFAVVLDIPNAVRLSYRSLRHWAVPKEYAQGTLRPVVILPGVYETWHYLRPVCDELNRAGHRVVVLTELGLNNHKIPATAEHVWRLLVERDLHDVAIVAHSKGGLIGKHLLAFDDKEGRIDRLVAIATPFSGTEMAALGVFAMREFHPGEQVISELVAQSSVNNHIISIYPHLDAHIPEGSLVPGARNVELSTTGHFRILLTPELPQLVVHEVERESLSEE